MANLRLPVLARTFAVAAALTLTATACGSSSSSKTPPGSPAATTGDATLTPTTTPTPTPTPTPTTTPTPSPTPSPITTPSPTGRPVEPASLCRLTELQITPGQSSAGAGHVGIPILFRNSGGRVCQLQGYPGVAGLNAAGQQAIQATRVSNQGAPALVTLNPGQIASALVLGTNVPSGTSTTACPQYTLLVTPPQETHSQRVAATIPGCALQVHPVILGTAGI